ncbi:cutinase family protein [Amycolatopsis thermoflava]|uniref:cutinase family protein n=1 Tax=Amycolatopsis thermoflava TaxID=84480 RepID=UPI00364FD442
MKKIAALLTGLAVAAAAYLRTSTIDVGGTGDNDSDDPYWQGDISQRVGYPAIPVAINARQGVDELNRLIRDQRNACPGQHVKAVGFSLGAAVVHTWVTENWPTIDNVNAVLIADPKRAAGPGNAGAAAHAGRPGGRRATRRSGRLLRRHPHPDALHGRHHLRRQHGLRPAGLPVGRRARELQLQRRRLLRRRERQWFNGVYIP